MLDPFDKIPDALKAKPKRLDAGFSIAFPGEEATEQGGFDEKVEAEITKANYALRVACNEMLYQGRGKPRPLGRGQERGRHRRPLGG